MNDNDIVQISEDEDEEVSTNKKPTVIDTIDIDEEDSRLSMLLKKTERTLKSIYNQNELLAKFIEYCYVEENTVGMLTAINKSLLRAYQHADDEYKKSPEFNRVLKNNFDLLVDQPKYKFSHIKNICDALKANRKRKKRVDLVTLATNLKGNKTTPFGSAKNIVIDLDEDDDDDVICVEEAQKGSKNETINTQTEKKIEQKKEETNEDALLESYVEVEWNPKDNVQNVIEVPVTFEKSTVEVNNYVVQAEILTIENAIAVYKRAVKELDEKEVENDNEQSPYLLSESYKKKIVDLYAKLCSLTDTQPVKRREVRLKVRDDYCAGPVKKLEKFLNNNIKSDGNPPFPDFFEVVQCVKEANDEDGLNWSKNRIMSEARALFEECGKALQMNRKSREWRELLSLVADQSLEDPADTDPVLLEKLNANRNRAAEKERELLEKYVQMEADPTRRKPRPPKTLNSNNNELNVNTNPDLSISNELLNNHSDLTITEVRSIVIDPHAIESKETSINDPGKSYDEIKDTNSNISSVATISNDSNNKDKKFTIDVKSRHDQENPYEIKDVNITNSLIFDSESTENNYIVFEENSENNNIPYKDVDRNLDSTSNSALNEIDSKETVSAVNFLIESQSDVANTKSNFNVTNKSPVKRKSNSKEIEVPNKKSKLNINSDALSITNSDVKVEVTNSEIEFENNESQENVENCEDGDVKVKIKEEPIDPIEILNKMNVEHCTSVITNILDPFLIVDISSDSSDDDE